jgi:catechol 2,3-dioxygenase-like lactoylglutathione lyase family enzyme
LSKILVRRDDSASISSHNGLGSPLSPLAKAQRKLIGLGVSCFFDAKRLGYRLRHLRGGGLGHADHVTIPCYDAEIAEAFYVGLLGMSVANRIDRKLLQRIGWRPDDIEKNAAEHLSLIIAGGPRFDLFLYPEGTPRKEAPMHPHIALTVAAHRFLWWKKYLEDNGVVVAGPTRPGPPGQASFYFNDPFGNHLEIVTLGFIASDLPVGVPDRSKLNYEWKERSG